MDLSPKLRELDKQIEQIELGMRQLIDTLLGGDKDKIPQHILIKIEERISRAAKKSPVFDIEKYQTTSGVLEFSDLRELQGIITSKSLWNDFQAIFKRKDSLNIKFDQLAELRNSIRHSRSVEDITRKEGEAAILWFDQVHNRN